MDFSGLFSLRKTGGKDPPKNPQQNSNQNLGVSQPKSTPQGSVVEIFVICGSRLGARGLEPPQGASGKMGPLRGL